MLLCLNETEILPACYTCQKVAADLSLDDHYVHVQVIFTYRRSINFVISFFLFNDWALFDNTLVDLLSWNIQCKCYASSVCVWSLMIDLEIMTLMDDVSGQCLRVWSWGAVATWCFSFYARRCKRRPNVALAFIFSCAIISLVPNEWLLFVLRLVCPSLAKRSWLTSAALKWHLSCVK